MKARVTVLLLGLVTTASLARADDQCINAYGSASVRTFLQELQTAVARNERAHVASLIKFPITIEIEGQRTKLSSRKQFLKYYDVAFDAKVKGFIAQQKFDSLFCDWKGIMIGRGEIWINAIGNPAILKIIAINNNPQWSPGNN